MKVEGSQSTQSATFVSQARLRSPSAAPEITGALTALVADVFSLYVKTTNFHWHLAGCHFRDYHELLEDHAAQILAMADAIAGRVRKLGGRPLHSIDNIRRSQRLADYDAACLSPDDIVAELREDNDELLDSMRQKFALCSGHRDMVTGGFIEMWIDQLKTRTLSLTQAEHRIR
jgi:starvation-inducible DNA-binding protein